MVRIRLRKMGRRNAPTYRMVVIDSHSKRDGKALEIIGYFNPQKDPVEFEYKKERVDYWLKNGASMSKAVVDLIDGKYEFKPYMPENKDGKNKETDEKIEEKEELKKE